MKNIWTFFSHLWDKKPKQLYKKEEDVVELKEKVKEEEVKEQVKEEVKEEQVKEEQVKEEQVKEEQVKEDQEEDKYTLELKNPNNYTSFEEEYDSSDDSENYTTIKEKRKLEEMCEQLVLDKIITECNFTS